MIRRLAEVDSTMNAAAGLPVGSVVVADSQTAGRGRAGRTWEAPPGTALLATFVLPPDPIVVFRAGVAAARACGPDVRLKWPNDLMLDGRKLGGVLAEIRGERALVGIGVNLTSAPEGAAMLRVDRDRLLDSLVLELQSLAQTPATSVMAAYRELSETLGQRVQVETPAGLVEGTAEAVRLDGALIVDGRPIVVGDVRRLRRSS
ncbi:MAG: biotin--[acetyl-CoA-carboxylase] ligase [Chloroflexi bacterium]|nr:MAG: biotin--[acetyl-CoA-carboxylase] ligase [Chloroflexota bacterium]TME19657.1 MAG: biotin--[acetyl-CoA-carboxylase] ligase [Chloroflexota bacterium]